MALGDVFPTCQRGGHSGSVEDECLGQRRSAFYRKLPREWHSGHPQAKNRKEFRGELALRFAKGSFLGRDRSRSTLAGRSLLVVAFQEVI